MGGVVRSAREWWYGPVTLIKVGYDRTSGVWTFHLTTIAPVVGDPYGEEVPSQYT